MTESHVEIMALTSNALNKGHVLKENGPETEV